MEVKVVKVAGRHGVSRSWGKISPICNITMREITSGEILAILGALEAHRTPVGDDVLFSLRQAMKTPTGKSILD